MWLVHATLSTEDIALPILRAETQLVSIHSSISRTGS
jgi:hypothetical protein